MEFTGDLGSPQWGKSGSALSKKAPVPIAIKLANILKAMRGDLGMAETPVL